ncbi:MAG TPA: hypothetical protein VK939_16440 [Longimicrobiales bacterium]|nr:hypothetical protein [Longimicrobiales bacterium]
MYDDIFAADEFADDTEGFGAIDPRDLHGADAPIAFRDPPRPAPPAAPPEISA